MRKANALATEKKKQTGEIRCLLKSELQKLQSFCLQVSAVYGSMLNLVIASNLPVMKRGQILQSKILRTKFVLLTPNLKGLLVPAKFKKEVVCRNLVSGTCCEIGERK